MLRALTFEQAELYSESRPRRASRAPAIRSPRPLSVRQLAIIRAMWEEKPHKQIAFELHTTDGSIKQETIRIRKRLGVRSTVGVALWWERNQGQFSKAS